MAWTDHCRIKLAAGEITGNHELSQFNVYELTVELLRKLPGGEAVFPQSAPWEAPLPTGVGGSYLEIPPMLASGDLANSTQRGSSLSYCPWQSSGFGPLGQ